MICPICKTRMRMSTATDGFWLCPKCPTTVHYDGDPAAMQWTQAAEELRAEPAGGPR